MSLNKSNSTDSIRSALKSQLRPGEELLWAQDAVHFSLFQGRDGVKTRNKMIAAVAGMGAFFALYFATVPETNVNLVLMLLALLAVMLLSPVLAWRTLNARRYAITNQRILTLKGDWLQGEMKLSAVDAVSCYETMPGAASLVLGGAIQEETDRQLRWRSLHPFGGDHGTYDGMVLYAVPNATDAMDILRTMACDQAA